MDTDAHDKAMADSEVEAIMQEEDSDSEEFDTVDQPGQVVTNDMSASGDLEDGDDDRLMELAELAEMEAVINKMKKKLETVEKDVDGPAHDDDDRHTHRSMPVAASELEMGGGV